MKLSFRRKSNNVERSIVREMAHFAIGQLLSPRLSQNITVSIRFRPNLYDGKEQAYGYLWYDAAIPRLRNFIIFVDEDLTHQMTLRTIAHEMVHLRQLATGQMRDYIRWEGVARFKGRRYKYDPDCASKKYKTEYPDEREALRLEKVLYRKFLKWNS